MTVDVGPLFQPLEVKATTLRNRIVMPPMVQVRGLTTSEGIEWYRERAAGGVGLAIVEAIAVDRFGAELTADGLRPLVDAIHGGGAVAAIQLFPRIAGVSSEPAAVTTEQIERIVACYRTAASVCVDAGFDGLEPHGAHGFLLNRFFSPVQNQRADGYGGSLEGRMRLALRIVEATREGGGSEAMVLYRHTPVGEGYGIDDSLALARELVAAGVDVLDISPASADAPGDRAAPFVGLGVPVIAVNELDVVDRALEVLAEGRAELVAVGRGLIADAEWPAKVRDGRFDEIVVCTRCNEKCFGNLRQGIPVECTQWP